MATLPKRFTSRARSALKRFQKVLLSARNRDVNESDTVVIISDFLSDVLGYDKYKEVTTEFAIRNVYCDLAIQVDGKLRFLIEVKAIGKDLRDNHLRQAVEYGATQGVDWVLLTNGVHWQAHRMRFEKPIDHDLVFALDLLDPDAKPAELVERLYLLSREAVSTDAINKFQQQQEATNRYVLAQVVLGDPVVKAIRREVRRMAKGLKVTEDEIRDRLQAEVLKRDVVEGERPAAAATVLKRATRRRARAAQSSGTGDLSTGSEPAASM